MSEKEKLQKAVEKTIAAGYQLDQEAFTLLSSIAATDDPTVIMHEALLKIEELPEKPIFIGKSFLISILKREESGEEHQLEHAQTSSSEETPAERSEQPKTD